MRSFADIPEALESLREEPADAVFCDYVLQDQDGLQMWQEMQTLPGGAGGGPDGGSPFGRRPP